jgi:hypothetical protein
MKVQRRTWSEAAPAILALLPRQNSVKTFAPELEQVAGVEFALFVLPLFLLVDMALLDGKSFQYFPFPISALVGYGGFLALEFESTEFGLKVLSQEQHVGARDQRKLEFGCAPSHPERGFVRLGGFGNKAIRSEECLVSARNCEAGFAQMHCSLPFKALPKS